MRSGHTVSILLMRTQSPSELKGSQRDFFGAAVAGNCNLAGVRLITCNRTDFDLISRFRKVQLNLW